MSINIKKANLTIGNLFEKLKIPYDDLRNRNNPIKPIIDYYRSIAKNGEEPWWMDTGDSSEVLIKPTVSFKTINIIDLIKNDIV